MNKPWLDHHSRASNDSRQTMQAKKHLYNEVEIVFWLLSIELYAQEKNKETPAWDKIREREKWFRNNVSIKMQVRRLHRIRSSDSELIKSGENALSDSIFAWSIKNFIPRRKLRLSFIISSLSIEYRFMNFMYVVHPACQYLPRFQLNKASLKRSDRLYIVIFSFQV